MGEYEGQVSESGSPDGLGKMIYNSGEVYNGQWKQGKPHGTGRLILSNGEVYSGEFDSGTRSGMGHMTYSNGDTYFGHWQEGNRHGTGQINYSTGGFYKGHFMDNFKHGHGMEQEKEIFFVGFWNHNVQISVFHCFSLETGQALEVQYGDNGEIANLKVLNPEIMRPQGRNQNRVDHEPSGKSRSVSQKKYQPKNQNMKDMLVEGLRNIRKMIRTSDIKIDKRIGENLPLINSSNELQYMRKGFFIFLISFKKTFFFFICFVFIISAFFIFLEYFGFRKLIERNFTAF